MEHKSFLHLEGQLAFEVPSMPSVVRAPWDDSLFVLSPLSHLTLA